MLFDVFIINIYINNDIFANKNNYIFILIIALKSLTFTNTVDADDCWKSRLICDDDYEY